MAELEGAAENEIDRSPPIAMFLSGEAFLKSAQHLHSAVSDGTLRLRYPAPIYYLYCHSMELALKAYLRARGIPTAALRSQEYGHRLQVLWDTCLQKGLRFDPTEEAAAGDVIRLLDPYATSYEFRYVEVGCKRLPGLIDVRCAAQAVSEAVRPTCNRTVLPGQ